MANSWLTIANLLWRLCCSDSAVVTLLWQFESRYERINLLKTKMKNQEIFDSLKEYINSGQYFEDARVWYRHKYIYPFTQRSFIMILSMIICVLFIGVVINIRNMFPVVIQVKYSIKANSFENKSAKIIRANQVENDPLASITDILVRNYLEQREAYTYNNLKEQFVFIKNNSTRIVFRRFYNYMSIDNPASPVMRYQKSINRTVRILNAKFPGRNKAIARFISEARNGAGELVENIVWEATIGYEIDKIDPNLPSGSRFNFTVTDYQLKLIEDRLKK